MAVQQPVAVPEAEWHPPPEPDGPEVILLAHSCPAGELQIPACRALAGRALKKVPRFDGFLAGLMITELTTNVIEHSRADAFTLRMSVVGRSRLRVAVADRGPRESTPHLTHAAPDAGWRALAEGGRGLTHVDELAARWGVEFARPWVVVWFELNPKPASGPSAAAHPSSSGG